MTLLRLCAVLFVFVICSSNAAKKAKGRTVESVDDEFPESRYTISQGSASWNTAKHDCELLNGENSTLAEIQTEKEFEVIKKLLDSTDQVGSYWIGAYYSVKNNRFIWETDESFVTDGKGWKKNPWAKQLPFVKSTKSRLFIEHRGAHQAVWSHAAETRLRKYICEKASSSSSSKDKDGGGGSVKGPVCENSYADVIVAIDVSYSMKDSIKDATSFVQDIVKVLKAHTGNRIALFLYTEEDIFWIFTLKSGLNALQMADKIDDIEYNNTQGESHIKAIETAVKHFDECDRQSTKLKSIVLLTDGETEPEQSNTIDVAKKIVKKNINIFAVKVLTEKVEEEPHVSNLPAITGGRKERVFGLDEQGQAAAAICAS